MSYLLDIKQGLLVTPNGGSIASNQQSAISNQQSAISNSSPFISTAFKSNSFISSSHHVHLFCLFSVSEHDCVL
ncbi:TPA: hypothetical protein I8Y58_002930 [Legionella pneumophila]|uniref:Uncharacterized protein n=1 Tax=Legionella pneumophila TaxID=446 RepID=A0AAN5KTI2_LEGPN|nr:hypothetical protein [Legionella pneumophila]